MRGTWPGERKTFYTFLARRDVVPRGNGGTFLTQEVVARSQNGWRRGRLEHGTVLMEQFGNDGLFTAEFNQC